MQTVPRVIWSVTYHQKPPSFFPTSFIVYLSHIKSCILFTGTVTKHFVPILFLFSVIFLKICYYIHLFSSSRELKRKILWRSAVTYFDVDED